MCSGQLLLHSWLGSILDDRQTHLWSCVTQTLNATSVRGTSDCNLSVISNTCSTGQLQMSAAQNQLSHHEHTFQQRPSWWQTSIWPVVKSISAEAFVQRLQVVCFAPSSRLQQLLTLSASHLQLSKGHHQVHRALETGQTGKQAMLNAYCCLFLSMSGL